MGCRKVGERRNRCLRYACNIGVSDSKVGLVRSSLDDLSDEAWRRIWWAGTVALHRGLMIVLIWRKSPWMARAAQPYCGHEQQGGWKANGYYKVVGNSDNKAGEMFGYIDVDETRES